MRIRSLFSFTTGAAVGAAAVYLFDPDHGPQRRREASKWAAEQAQQQAREAALRVVDVSRQAVTAASDGYREAGGTTR